MRKSVLFASAPVAAALVIAGCGGGGGGYSQVAPSKTAGATPTVMRAHSKFGEILVDGRGRTLYDFVADKTTSSTCYGACASLWPPLTVSGTPTGGAQLRASLLGTTKRTDGTAEVTYNGHPLYYFVSDTKPGDTTGQNISQFGALWYVLTRNGAEVHGG
jgi:predicted lipoprotein with Yx(FWY)xxD motif